MERLIKVILSFCFFLYLTDCIFLIKNEMLLECFFVVLLPFASLGVLIFYSKRSEEQKKKENIGWVTIATVSAILSLMMLYLSLGYENEYIIQIMELVTVFLILFSFWVISKIKFR